MSARFTLMLLVPALLLSGCKTGNSGVESVYQPVVQRYDYIFDLQTAADGLAQGESRRLAGWLESMRLRYGDHVSIDDGADGLTARSEIAAEANRYGLLIDARAPVTMGQIAPGTVRVIVTRMTASVPGCPDHSGEQTPDFSQNTSSNYGCAVNANLAAMVADPGDLVRGVPGAPSSDPATGTKAIKALRDATPTGGGGTVVKSEGTKGGGK